MGAAKQRNKMENKYSKPGYDGRLKYYEHLKSYWDRLAEASFSNDYMGWKIALRGYFSRTRSFIKDCLPIENSFKKIDNLINILGSFDDNNQGIIIGCIINQLQKIEDSLFVATKDMLVSTKDEAEESFDMESFAKDAE